MRRLLARAKGKGVAAARATSLAAAVVAAVVTFGHAAAGRAALVRDPAAGQLVVTITDGGLTPAQATVQAGLVHLRAENRAAGESPLTLRVALAGGAQVRDISVPARGGEVARVRTVSWLLHAVSPEPAVAGLPTHRGVNGRGRAR